MSSLSGPDPAVMEAIERGNAVVFLDVALGEGDVAAPLGRIKLELFVQDVSDASRRRQNKWRRLRRFQLSHTSLVSISNEPFCLRSAQRRARTFGSSVRAST